MKKAALTAYIGLALMGMLVVGRLTDTAKRINEDEGAIDPIAVAVLAVVGLTAAVALGVAITAVITRYSGQL